MASIAIDFDGTIHNDKAIPAGHRLGPPMEGAVFAVNSLRARGYKIVVFCVWANSEKNIATIAKWMDYFDLPYDDITNIKPDAVAYIDDRGLYFQSWKQTLQELNERIL